MATSKIRFESVLPILDITTGDYAIIEQFKTNIRSLTPCYTYPVYDVNSLVSWCFFGYIDSAQQATALGFLNTLLNSVTAPTKALISTFVWNGTSEP